MSKLKHVVNLVVGDWSRDGHGHSDNVTIRSTLDKAAISKAYQKGTEIVGFNLSDEVASDYEDSRIRGDELKKLRAAGYTEPFDDEYPEGEEGEYGGTGLLDPETFVELYLWIAQKGNSALQYEVIDASIEIGGYGLYSL